MMNGRSRVYFMIGFLAMVLLLFVRPVSAATSSKDNDPKYVFYKANTLYEEGKYEEAIGVYTRLIDQGLESGNLYYNIGNCYFRTGNIGKAIVNYERARRLMPQDDDLKANYRYARSFVKGNASEEKASWYTRVTGVFGFLSVNGLTLFIALVFSLTFLFLILGLFVRQLIRWRRFVLPVLIVIFVAGVLTLSHRVSMIGTEAVVISESADAGYEPVEGATTYFTLYEGMRITVVETLRDWSKIERPDGKIGWILTGSYEII